MWKEVASFVIVVKRLPTGTKNNLEKPQYNQCPIADSNVNEKCYSLSQPAHFVCFRWK